MRREREPEEMRRDFVCSRACLPLTEEGVEIVRLAEDSPLSNVECLRQGFQVQQAPR